jgi:hypothetical protein
MFNLNIKERLSECFGRQSQVDVGSMRVSSGRRIRRQLIRVLI